jgi:hypothetical protein
MLPLCPAGAPREAEQTEAFFRQTVRTAMIRLAETAGLDVEQVLAPPPRPDMDTRSYCPRCGSGFTRTDATCSTCGDRPAVAYA